MKSKDFYYMEYYSTQECESNAEILISFFFHSTLMIVLLFDYRYLPESCVSHSDHLSHKSRHEINTVNIELVKKLKATDTAFSLGKAIYTVINYKL